MPSIPSLVVQIPGTTRSPMKFKFIAVEGAIGVGKSSLVDLMAEHFDAKTIKEEVDNPFLSDFYQELAVAINVPPISLGTAITHVMFQPICEFNQKRISINLIDSGKVSVDQRNGL